MKNNSAFDTCMLAGISRDTNFSYNEYASYIVCWTFFRLVIRPARTALFSFRERVAIASEGQKNSMVVLDFFFVLLSCTGPESGNREREEAEEEKEKSGGGIDTVPSGCACTIWAGRFYSCIVTYRGRQ